MKETRKLEARATETNACAGSMIVAKNPLAYSRRIIHKRVMIKSSFILCLIVCLSAVVAEAKIMKVPNAELAVATVEIPDNWNPEEIADGVTGASEDTDVVVVTATEKKKDAETDIADAFAILKDHGIEVDQASKKVSKIKVSGIEAEEMRFQGKETLGSHTSQSSIIIVRLAIKDKVVVLTEFVSAEDAKKSKDVVEKIIQSLKPAG
jgi:hypothetical protein